MDNQESDTEEQLWHDGQMSKGVRESLSRAAHASEDYYKEHQLRGLSKLAKGAAHANDEEQQEGHPQEYGDSN